jgi:hypothetical protein
MEFVNPDSQIGGEQGQGDWPGTGWEELMTDVWFALIVHC